MGLKSSDRETMPLCWRHHRAFHDGNGPFDGWSRDDRRIWQMEQVERCQQAHALVAAVLELGEHPGDSSGDDDA
jgi:hypothetical protein